MIDELLYVCRIDINIFDKGAADYCALYWGNTSLTTINSELLWILKKLMIELNTYQDSSEVGKTIMLLIRRNNKLIRQW